jgi:hypothetical protein
MRRETFEPKLGQLSARLNGVERRMRLVAAAFGPMRKAAARGRLADKWNEDEARSLQRR